MDEGFNDAYPMPPKKRTPMVMITPERLAALEAADAREAGLREALSEFADPDNWWMADAVDIYGHPIKAKAWRFGTMPWLEAQKALALSAAPPREAEDA